MKVTAGHLTAPPGAREAPETAGDLPAVEVAPPGAGGDPLEAATGHQGAGMDPRETDRPTEETDPLGVTTGQLIPQQSRTPPNPATAYRSSSA